MSFDGLQPIDWSGANTTMPPFAWSPEKLLLLRVPPLGDARQTESKFTVDDVWTDREARPRPMTEAPSTSVEALPKAIQDNWNRIALSKPPPRTYQRIRQIARKEAGWRGRGSYPLSSQSLEWFLEFWKLIRGNASEPELAITPSGRLQVDWYKNSRRHLDIEFAENGTVFYGFFDGKSVHEGVETYDVLAEWLRSRESKPLRWHPK